MATLQREVRPPGVSAEHEMDGCFKQPFSRRYCNSWLVTAECLLEFLKICTYFNIHDHALVFYRCYKKQPPARWLKTTPT